MSHPNTDRPFQALALGIYRQMHPTRLEPLPNHPSLIGLEVQFRFFACEAAHYICPDALVSRIVSRATYLYEQQYALRSHSRGNRSRVITALAWGLCGAAGNEYTVMRGLMKRTYLNMQAGIAAQHTAGDGGAVSRTKSAVREMKTLEELESERLEWSLKTFTEATPISSLRKLESEIKEIEYDLENGIRRPEEYADALMCLLDSAGRAGIFLPEIIGAFAAKLEKNKKRTWKKNPDNSYSHVKP